MEDKRKHLEMIQGIINRMARCSFLLKGWSVVIISALFALSSKNDNASLIKIAFFPAFIFWVLDGFYLWQERLFRALYDDVRIKKEDDIDFSMKTKKYKKKVKCWFCILFSDTIILFHLCVIVIISFIIILGINNQPTIPKVLY